MVNSSDRDFIHSAPGKSITASAGRNVDRDGYMLKTGYLLTEQNNSRLKNCNNRFVLTAKQLAITTSSVSTQWSITDVYEFEPFSRADFYTTIPLSSSLTLRFPDGLSQYMAVLRIADTFEYVAEWSEAWHV